MRQTLRVLFVTAALLSAQGCASVSNFLFDYMTNSLLSDDEASYHFGTNGYEGTNQEEMRQIRRGIRGRVGPNASERSQYEAYEANRKIDEWERKHGFDD